MKEADGLSVIIPVKWPEPYLYVIRNDINRILEKTGIKHEVLIQDEKGLTNGVIRGVKRSNYSNIVVIDADGSHDPTYLPKMFAYRDKYDLIIGSRNKDETSFIRRQISRVFRSIAQSILQLDVNDSMSGYVMGSKRLFYKLQPSNDYKFLLQLLNLKPKIIEIPIIFHKRKLGKSHTTLRTGLQTLFTILKLKISQVITEG